MTTIRHCSILEFGRGHTIKQVAPGITRPLHATDFSRHDVLTCIFIISLSRSIILLLTVIVPVFDLGMSFGKVKSGKSPEKNLEKVLKKSGNLYSGLRRNPASVGYVFTQLTNALQRYLDMRNAIVCWALMELAVVNFF